MSVSCECCVGSGTGKFVGLIPRLEESYREWCISDLETSTMRRPRHRIGAAAPQEKRRVTRSRTGRTEVQITTETKIFVL